MTESPDPQYRQAFQATGSEVTVREDLADDEGVFEIRMPIASSGEVRNEGDDPLTRDELEGMARQIGESVVSVFPDHGNTDISMDRYSIAEIGGEWEEAEVNGAQDTTSGEDELVATARLMDPETLPMIPIRDYLGSIKSLAERDMSIPASIGWREEDASPGGNDLMEASMVGIGADPITTSDSDPAVVARAAVEAGADPGELVATVREAVTDANPDAERPFGPPDGPPDLWDDFEDCVQDVEDWEGVDDPEAFCAWAEDQSADADDTDTDSDHDMTDQDTPPDDDGDTTDEQDTNQEGIDANEFRERMLEMQEEQTELLQSLTEREDEEEDDDTEDDEDEQATDEDEDGDEEDEDEDDEEQSADEQEATDDDLQERITELEDELEAVRTGEADVDTPGDDGDEDDTEQRDTTDDDTTTDKYGLH